MKKNNRRLSTVFKIAFTYIGSVIGAGFASGKEIYNFFIQYGEKGLIGLVLAGALFIGGGVAFMGLARRHRVSSYYQLFYKLFGKRAGYVIDIVYIIFILGSISIMLAGSGYIFEQALGVNYNIGVLFTLAIVLITIGFGVKGVFLLNTLLIPFLIVIIIVTSLFHLNCDSIQVVGSSFDSRGMPWIISGIIYVAFNLFLALAILSSISAEVREGKVVKLGGFLGGGFLTLILLLMGIALFRHVSDISYAEMPMLIMADKIGPLLHGTYMVGIWSAMVTTAVANAYGFINRVVPLFRLSFYNAAMLTIVVVLPLTRLGFANLVKYLYPVYGVVAFVVLVLMIIKGR